MGNNELEIVHIEFAELKIEVIGCRSNQPVKNAKVFKINIKEGDTVKLEEIFDRTKEDLLYLDFLRRDDDRNGQVIEHIIRTGGYDLPMPLIDGENYDDVMNIDGLKSEIKRLFNVDSLYMPEKCIPVKSIIHN